MMKQTVRNKKPTKEEQKAAMASYDALASSLKRLTSDNPEIEIEETGEKVSIPMSALQLLSDILKAMSEGKPVTMMPLATEITTQKAAELLGCSRPHVVKLLKEGKIPFTKVGRHRRIQFEDVMKYKQSMKNKQKDLLIEMMKDDEESGLYDT